MSVVWKTSNSWRRVERLAAFMLILTVFAALPAAAANPQTKDAVSQQPATTTTPQAEFQYSALTGSGNTIVATRVPSVNSEGQTSYWDITLLFDVASDGTLTLDPSSPQIVLSPTLLTSSFQAGNYVGPSNILSGQALITVAGPGVGPGGATEWTLAASPGASSCTYPASATWYVGPLASNPIESRLKKAGITSPAYSYGTGGGGCDDGLTWESNSLLGFSQVGTTITIYSYTYNGTDYSTPQAQITYTQLTSSSSTSVRKH
jgi:hypothetical protein